MPSLALLLLWEGFRNAKDAPQKLVFGQYLGLSCFALF
jgi:hypothetical protein